jgi:hypothetical protein
MEAQISHSKPMGGERTLSWQLGSTLIGLMYCIPKDGMFGQKLEFKRFIKSPDWLRFAQWKPRYPILSQWEPISLEYSLA